MPKISSRLNEKRDCRGALGDRRIRPAERKTARRATVLLSRRRGSLEDRYRRARDFPSRTNAATGDALAGVTAITQNGKRALARSQQAHLRRAADRPEGGHDRGRSCGAC